jgi:hypothetical protein
VKRRRRFYPDDYITFGLAVALTLLFCGLTFANWPGYVLPRYPVVHEHFSAVR